jgi:autotransporter-associated beta strand protein
MVSGAGALTKIGGNTLTLSAANSFTGGLYVNGGTVNATTSPHALGNTGALVVNPGGTLQISRSAVLDGPPPRAVTVNQGGTLQVSTPGATNLSNATFAAGSYGNPMTPNGAIGNGTLKISADVGIGGGAAATPPTAAIAGTYEINTGAVSSGFNVKMADGSIINVTTACNYSSNIDIAGTVRFDSTNIMNLNLTGQFTGTGSILKTGNNALTFMGPNPAPNLTELIIATGLVTIGSGLGTAYSTPITLSSNGGQTLNFGSGAAEKVTGNIYAAGGTVAIFSGANLGGAAGQLTLLPGAVLRLDADLGSAGWSAAINTATSYGGTIALNVPNPVQNITMPGASMRLGAGSGFSGAYTGALTPAASKILRLGGGGSTLNLGVFVPNTVTALDIGGNNVTFSDILPNLNTGLNVVGAGTTVTFGASAALGNGGVYVAGGTLTANNSGGAGQFGAGNIIQTGGTVNTGTPVGSAFSGSYYLLSGTLNAQNGVDSLANVYVGVSGVLAPATGQAPPPAAIWGGLRNGTAGAGTWTLAPGATFHTNNSTATNLSHSAWNGEGDH